MKNKLKNILQTLFFISIGLAFIWWFWEKLGAEERVQIWQSLKQTNYFWFLLAAIVSLTSNYVRALRWNLMGETIGCKVSSLNSFLAVMSGYLTNLAVPRLGEVVRCTMLKKSNDVPIEKSLGTIITERAVDMLLFLLLLLLTFLTQRELFLTYIERNFNLDINSLIKLAAIGISALLLLFVLFLIFRKRLKHNAIYKKIAELAKGLWEGIKSVSELKNPFLFILYSLTIWALWIFGTYICFRCLKETEVLNFIQAMVTTVLGAFGPMITPGGIGLQPAIFAEVLGSYDISRAIGYVVGWLNWISSQIGTIVIGLFAFIYFSSNKRKQ